ncbi:hypothetical protein PM3016_529 [Paenibacillus mucilaginosus 3016]|uniref:Polyphosphate kinase-2-related domain-containing protein n=1 Tax=Paenibacillus mucilaginosus 3016 TaxID=1116391 RepID=H6NSV5_9BACL|nr:PPK2 family polyphosphate kinase [Paenibacillus mucilaginosus]AFC27496.1 hypothetical protein PM3016_529 [Paenibacillus mucilaginosus 3016]WFA16397.1 polyphosphate kinase 2 family protein [Paenibacillus mucilaginosus]
MLNRFRLHQSEEVDLSSFDPEETGGIESKDQIRAEYEDLQERLKELQDKLYAGKSHAVLIIFQGMDCSGKDGVIKKVLANLNPQGFRAESFKKPTADEAAHDFLWRTHKVMPAKGYMAAFNRSYYEDVLITRVHGLISDEEADRRLDHIRHFEALLLDNHVVIIKIFLHISPEFQLGKIRERLESPEKLWKFDMSDLQERRYWEEYRKAYEVALARSAKKRSPWYVVPANKRWFRDYLVLRIIVEELEALPLQYPTPEIDLAGLFDDRNDRRPEA